MTNYFDNLPEDCKTHVYKILYADVVQQIKISGDLLMWGIKQKYRKYKRFYLAEIYQIGKLDACVRYY